MSQAKLIIKNFIEIYGRIDQAKPSQIKQSKAAKPIKPNETKPSPSQKPSPSRKPQDAKPERSPGGLAGACGDPRGSLALPGRERAGHRSLPASAQQPDNELARIIKNSK